jgi:hypothetical protein
LLQAGANADKALESCKNCDKSADRAMLRSRRAQRAAVVETLRDAANVAAGALIFGQALSDRRYSLALGALGICAWLVLLGAAVGFARREE